MKDYTCDGVIELLITTSYGYIFLKIIKCLSMILKNLIKQGQRNNES